MELLRWKTWTRYTTVTEKPKKAPPLARVVCVASGKGGTGKSVLAANLGVARARAGERVLLVDFDAGMANAHLLLGVQPRFDLGHVLAGEVSASYAVVEAPGGLALLSGGVGGEALVNPTRRELDRLFLALRELESQYDLILIDHGAGLSFGSLATLAAATTLLVVTSHEVTALSDAYALVKHVVAVNASARLGLVLNRAPDERTAALAVERFGVVCQRFLAREPEHVGSVPHDEAVARSVQMRSPVVLSHPGSRAAAAIEGIARWEAIDLARGSGSFYDRARAVLR